MRVKIGLDEKSLKEIEIVERIGERILKDILGKRKKCLEVM